MRRLLSRRFLLALAVSLSVHFLMVAGTEFNLPDWAVEQDRIEITLAPPPPKPLKNPIPEPATPATPKVKSRAKPVSQKPPAPVSTTPEAPPGRIAAVEPSRVEEPPTAIPEPVSTDTPPVAIADEPVAVPSAPKRVEIEFSGFNGSKGTGKQLFELADEGHYKLSGEMSMPIILFFSGSIEQHSEGLITPKGLQPMVFHQKTTGGKPQLASFDWAANRVTLDTGKRTDVLDLPPGTQDFISFMYQFMFTPPLDEMRLNIVTGKKLKTYVYEFEGEESLTTKMGVLRTVHIGKSSQDSDEKTELWLSVDHRHLPVRIRKTNKDGSAIDLIATRLNITE